MPPQVPFQPVFPHRPAPNMYPGPRPPAPYTGMGADYQPMSTIEDWMRQKTQAEMESGGGLYPPMAPTSGPPLPYRTGTSGEIMGDNSGFEPSGPVPPPPMRMGGQKAGQRHRTPVRTTRGVVSKPLPLDPDMVPNYEREQGNAADLLGAKM